MFFSWCVKRGFRADNRNVTLSDNLIAWLKLLQGTGLVFPGHSRRWRDRVQKALRAEQDVVQADLDKAKAEYFACREEVISLAISAHDFLCAWRGQIIEARSCSIQRRPALAAPK